MKKLDESIVETGFFTMDDVHHIDKMLDLALAKAHALNVAHSKPARKENVDTVEKMIMSAKSKTHLMQGMCNFMLAHGGLKV